MKILVKVKTGARAERVEKFSENEFVVFVRARPERGRANEAVVDLLAKYFVVPQSKIKIISGHAYRKKLIEIIY